MRCQGKLLVLVFLISWGQGNLRSDLRRSLAKNWAEQDHKKMIYSTTTDKKDYGKCTTKIAHKAHVRTKDLLLRREFKMHLR